MNALAERAIEHELAVIGSELEEKLRRTIDLLRPYRREEWEADVEAFARAEVTEDDPLRSTAAEASSDPVAEGAKSSTARTDQRSSLEERRGV